MRFLLLLLCGAALQAQHNPVFRAGISLVHVDAEVTRDGRLVTGLGMQDFRVKDEGTAQTILQFSAEEQPLDLILLFDVSGSMRPAVSRLSMVARQSLDELRGGDRVAVMAFSYRNRVILPFTGDLDLVDRTIRTEVRDGKFGGATFLQNAMAAAAREFMPEPRSERRRAVLVITDDQGQRTRSTASVARDFWEADAILSGLIVESGMAMRMRGRGGAHDVVASCGH